ncbi:hypothetical protein [uncultured Cyclobacterium sp.]|uniref:hypothetical protein n=1 Tax=uncultured Cyclobacterium sp. TaxID=453820 RepID=UPI0030EC64ED|tara:strand:+ start:97659 stop:99233 length:1575 start_codon:yes stop_codon:yes gene_type:complete
MKKFRFTTVIAGLIILCLGVSCKKEPLPEIPPTGNISFDIDIEGCFRSSLSSERINDITSIYVSIENECGIIEGYPKKFEDFSLEEYTIHLTINNLPTGGNRLSLLLLMDINGEVIYASPLTKSQLSANTPNPLPLQFETLENQINTIAATALSTRCFTPGDFGIDAEEVNFREGLENVGGTFEGEIDISSQKKIDDFGAFCYTKIKGGLKIASSDEQLDLSPLRSIQEIGYLHIYSNPQLKSVKGFHSLVSLDHLTIENNTNLTSLEGFSNLKEVKNRATFLSNPKLIDLKGLDKLITVKNYLRIQDNYNLSSLNGLNNLTNCETIHIWYNPKLRSILDLENLTINSIELGLNPSLEPFWEIFSPLKEINALSLSNMEIDNFANKFPDGFKITESLNLNKISGLESLNGLPIGRELQGNLTIRDILKLENLEGLENLQSIKGNLFIDLHPNLKTLKGLDSLSIVGGKITIKDNNTLDDLCALNKLFHTNPKHALTITKNAYNPKLSDFTNGRCYKYYYLPASN